MIYQTSQQKRATAAWCVLGAVLLAGLVWAVPAQGITVDGIISTGEWTDANVVIWDPNESDVSNNYDLEHIKMEDGQNSLYVSITVYGDKIALAAEGSERPYLNYYFNLYAGGGPIYRLGLTYNNGYGFDPGYMHLVRYDDGRWNDLGKVDEFAIGDEFVTGKQAVEVKILWDMLPAKLTSGGPIAVQGLFFLYNVAPGDANADGAVDVGDLGILAGNYGAVGGVGWTNADFNLDGCVDVGDLGILAGHYGYNADGEAQYDIFDAGTEVMRNVSLTKHTPEPLTMLAVFTGIAGLAGYIRRRRKA